MDRIFASETSHQLSIKFVDILKRQGGLMSICDAMMIAYESLIDPKVFIMRMVEAGIVRNAGEFIEYIS